MSKISKTHEGLHTIDYSHNQSQNFYGPYISDHMAHNIKQYKYKGGDLGLTYRLFYNPVANWIIERFPENIAPNLITLIGFFFTLVPCILMFSLYGLDFNSPVSGWFNIMVGICYLVYRILDEMDGKQARKTGNSSPLGLQFDHGCDAFTAGIISLMILKSLQIGNGEGLLLGMFIGPSAFYYTILEEYYTGGLFLGVINGVTDGSLLIVGLFVYMGIAGNSIFTNMYSFYIGQNLHSLTGSLMFIIFLVFVACINVLISWFNILKYYYREAKSDEFSFGNGENDKYRVKFRYAILLQQISAFLILYFLFVAVNIFQQEALIEFPLLPFLLFVCVFVHNTLTLQTAHVTLSHYNPWNKVYLFNVTVLGLNLILNKLFKVQTDITVLFVVLLCITTVCQWHYILCVIDEMATILEIRVLVPKPKQQLRTPLLDHKETPQQAAPQNSNKL